ncbi:cation diffusion facilitator family transporter [Singulisphaera acidiphila]|uniref:Cation diffusion facilitator family transporter n=1 Tax=Singulisphaera acidiphila (strain ATCC BAA-1392 / DSM 18658 / VKM B-2454 / MOB10) TaxID=886293 RepID=L0DM97_SINAD|nr:cation diffusion facilitator family transporter [Singulisphaera acidiphila]AGA29968.1 cation diffusion facilitator family transporter [Singulisphaera acidiphila DSM 18658]
MGDIAILYQKARRAALWGVAVNSTLGLIKLLGGMYGHSFALVTDGAHSLVDALISGSLVAALFFAQRPADREHPYGHTRVEALVGAGVGLLLILLAMALGWEAWSTRKLAHPSPHAFTLIVAAFGAICQEALSRYAIKTARRTGSGALLATAWDYRLDVFGSLLVLFGVALTKWGGPSWQMADRIAAGLVATLIVWVASKLLWENVQDLMDRQANPLVLQDVRLEALAVAGVQGVEKLRVRKAGLEYLVDIHVEVDPDLTVREGHNIAHAVKDQVITRLDPIRDVLVHIEPSRTNPNGLTE